MSQRQRGTPLRPRSPGSSCGHQREDRKEGAAEPSCPPKDTSQAVGAPAPPEVSEPRGPQVPSRELSSWQALLSVNGAVLEGTKELAPSFPDRLRVHADGVVELPGRGRRSQPGWQRRPARPSPRAPLSLRQAGPPSRQGPQGCCKYCRQIKVEVF